ncbi:glycosyltransferase family 2 protein, partial [Bacteroidota bacterium]
NQKNYANGIAKHDWILSIDADEALSDELKNAIGLTKKEGLTGAYSFNRLTNYCGKWIKHSGWYPDTKVRLFDRRITQWIGTVHETLNVDARTIKKLTGDLHHYSYYTISEHLAQTDKFSSLAATELQERGASPSVFKAMFNAWLKFNKFYFIKMGFLDGVSGLNISVIASYGTYLKYMKHYFLVRKNL